MTSQMERRVHELEQMSGSDSWSFIMVMASEEEPDVPWQGSVWGIEGKIYPDAGEGMKDFCHRLQVIDFLSKRPEEISSEEMAVSLSQLAKAGKLKTPKASTSRSAVHAMEFEDD